MSNFIMGQYKWWNS